MKKTSKVPKLALNREKVRELVANELSRAAGGNVNGHTTPDCGCSSGSKAKCAYLGTPSDYCCP